MHLLVLLFILQSFLMEIYSFCPSQCSCIYHGRSDGSGTRSVLCNDPDMSEVPVNVPVDTVKLRIEKTVVRRIPNEAFYYLVDLKYLWLTYNAITNIDTSSFYNLKQVHELRLDGNLFSTFPWESLKEMPNLRTLDLHNNRLATVPAEAAHFLKNITYLDLSSNKLTTLPTDVMDIWTHMLSTPSPILELYPSRVILGFQDNLWYCDCRISKLIELSKLTDISFVLLDPFVVCNGPENLAGVPFQKAELEQCLKPSVMTSATKITSSLGSNVLLRCDATGYPTPYLMWTRSDSSVVNHTVIQESPTDGARWSILSLTGISYKDAGEYKCKAKNLAGMSEASITLSVVGVVTTTVPPQKFVKNLEKDKEAVATTEAEEEEATVVPTTASLVTAKSTTTTTNVPKKKGVLNSQPKVGPDGKNVVKQQPMTNVSIKLDEHDDEKLKERVTSLNATSHMTEQTIAIKNLKAMSETDKTVILSWKVLKITEDAVLNVVYSRYGQKDMQMLTIEPGKSRITIDDLLPNTKYTACVCLKGTQPRKDQCTTFVTDVPIRESNNQTLILIIISSVACAVVLPVFFFLLYKVIKLQCISSQPAEDELSKDTYVKFETLSLRARPVVTSGADRWIRRDTAESQRLLLCSRSSIDSQMTFRSDASKPEYFF
ncbi:leucine-rich repeat, immunoglobulin-like domain and transmembrane domain-containing protein 3 [Protopterus annectens]|uniref:leucine-rich repeat, immunoglobulin-like domain and transmembrane domain-containing protein 3 n=1 Tax=Protopterus annectens TaxID=7888 RepID=UPI001CFB5755|nr:leucine-rich repeat, immunoglobulin-like domain and transmembrane domain-containing protein 3 [Protopterus annectens]